jgi:LacI family transcriptional regulator, galactose operon repressor
MMTHMPHTRTTIKDVARRCGVHASTVSRVLNPQTRAMVSEEVAERILRVADRLGYQHNRFASGLRTRRSYTVGVLIPDLTNPVFPPIVRGVERTLSNNGFTAILADSANDQRNEQAILESLQGRQVDGLILATAHRKDPVVAACVERHIPVVLVNRSVDDPAVSAVVNDDEAGIRLALEHLIERGHRGIAYVGGPQSTSTGYARYRAFLKVARALGLAPDKALAVNARSFDEEAGERALADILARDRPFTAVVSANDLLALGCYDAIAARGLNCPRDLSVTGFNDMPFVDRCNPPLTTVHIQHDELGAAAARLLLERIREPASPARLLSLEPRLVIRGSTRALAVRG